MSNTYFQFKQFTVHQEHCAMKVCTDACLFGAWLADTAHKNKWVVQQALDIGTGTGLLSLLFAQTHPAQVHAVEIDQPAAEQAAANFKASPWHSQLQVVQGAIQHYQPGMLYDLIFSNPPFFEQDLKSGDHKRNLALHSEELKLDELATAADCLLTCNGVFAILLPFHRLTAFVETAKEKNLFLKEAVLVKQSFQHHYFRAMLLFGRTPVEPLTSDMAIRGEEGYTTGFTRLLHPYYLKL